MGRRTVDEARVVLSAEAKGLVRGLGVAQNSIKKFAKVAALSLLGISGVAGLGRAFDKILENADKLNNTAKKIGLSTTALQELRFAAEEVGVETNTTDMAMQRFVRRVGEAAQGSGELLGTLKQYNISARDAEGNTRAVEDVLDDLADAIAGAESEQEQLRISFKAFDSEGAALVSTLRDGSSGLDEMRQKAHDLGLVIEHDTIQEMASLNRELEILSDRAGNSAARAMGKLARHLNDVGINAGIFEASTVDQAKRRVEVLEKRLSEFKKLLDTPNRWANPAELERLKKIKSELDQALLVREKLVLLEKNESQEIEASKNRTDIEQRAEKFTSILSGVESRTQSVISSILKLQGVATSEIELSITALNIENKLKADGIDLNERERDQLREALSLLGDKIDKNEELTDSMAKNKKAAEEWTGALNSGLADAIFRAKSFNDVLDALLKRMLNSALFGIDGKSGLLGGITNSVGSALGSIFSFGLADGGMVRGPGGPRADKIPAMLSDGEYVINAASTKKFLPLLNAINGGIPAFADGGLVSTQLTRMKTAVAPRPSLAGASSGGSLPPTVNNYFDLIPGPTIAAMIDQRLPELARASAALVIGEMNGRG